jgi:prolyl 4-hydroxylase
MLMPFIDETVNSFVFSDHHQCKVILRSKLPKLTLASNFLLTLECQQLIQLAQKRLKISEVIGSKGEVLSQTNHRNSYDANFVSGELNLLNSLDERVATICNWRINKSTGWQVVRYQTEEYFAPHFDYFSPEILASRGEAQRVASIIVYLNDVKAGGATEFPDAGLSFIPEVGTALFFSYQSPRRSTMTFHAGTPVLAGEKWIAVKWLTV